MSRLLTLATVANVLGYAPAYVRRIAADQGKPPAERRYSNAYHERFPQFIRDGNRKTYFVTEGSFNAWMARRGRKWEVAL